MQQSPTTRPSLLLRIRDARDKDAWRQFVEVYAPLIYRYARRCRLQDADANDVTQEVLRAVARASHRLDYDPCQGTFRAWLLTIVRNKLCDWLAKQKERGTGDPETQQLLDALPARAEETVWWELEYERRVFAWASEKVRVDFEGTTWAAFWQTAVEGKSGKEAADLLGLSVGAVYIAKSRVMSRLKEQILQLTGDNSD